MIFEFFVERLTSHDEPGASDGRRVDRDVFLSKLCPFNRIKFLVILFTRGGIQGGAIGAKSPLDQ